MRLSEREAPPSDNARRFTSVTPIRLHVVTLRRRNIFTSYLYVITEIQIISVKIDKTVENLKLMHILTTPYQVIRMIMNREMIFIN
jgi:hypothetical protein